MLEASLATSMVAAALFGNVLVHGYATVDDERVLAYLDELGTLDRFVAAVAALTV